MRIAWMLVLAQIGLATYALRAVCWQIGRDRRCPSPDRITAVRVAFWTAMLLMAWAMVMWGASDGRRYAVVMDYVCLACMAASAVAGLAIRLLKGDGGPRD